MYTFMTCFFYSTLYHVLFIFIVLSSCCFIDLFIYPLCWVALSTELLWTMLLWLFLNLYSYTDAYVPEMI